MKIHDSPSRLLLKLADQLFLDEGEKRAFLSSLTNPQDESLALLWLHERPEEFPFALKEPVSWQPPTVDRLLTRDKPGTHILHEQGHYYCLDLSSVFSASAMLASNDIPSYGEKRVILDLCSSPGGKGIFAWRMLSPDLLICNEVIRKRSAQLISNLKRCHISPVRVVSYDPDPLSKRAPEAFGLVIVDAPCSGQSLIARGKRSAGCFHPVTIKKNANRQKRILACSTSLVAPQGYLQYITCTYSTEENEEVISWLTKRFPHFVPQEVPHLGAHRSALADFPCYRLWPHQGFGAGGFVTLLKNSSSGSILPLEEESLRAFWRS